MEKRQELTRLTRTRSFSPLGGDFGNISHGLTPTVRSLWRHFCVLLLVEAFFISKKPDAFASGFGAGNQNRTDDLVITNDVLYRLSHTSTCDFDIITDCEGFVNTFLQFFVIFYLNFRFFIKKDARLLRTSF